MSKREFKWTNHPKHFEPLQEVERQWGPRCNHATTGRASGPRPRVQMNSPCGVFTSNTKFPVARAICGSTARGRATIRKMIENGLPCLDLLEATPEVLRGLMCELSGEDARWKPAPDRFCAAEILAHLSHAEGHCYRSRLDRFLSEELPEFESDDAQFWLNLYRNAAPEDAFDHFEEQRITNVEFLRGLPAGSGDRKALHKAVGEITLSQMLHEWALHDLGHVRQVAELARARKYLAGAGPLGVFYQLKP